MANITIEINTAYHFLPLFIRESINTKRNTEDYALNAYSQNLKFYDFNDNYLSKNYYSLSRDEKIKSISNSYE